jgi:hypothetical protein|tara:strand:+ start:786 stop:980 length:195 start_codon:yes stop_codon:yes gene_type:complete
MFNPNLKYRKLSPWVLGWIDVVRKDMWDPANQLKEGWDMKERRRKRLEHELIQRPTPEELLNDK